MYMINYDIFQVVCREGQVHIIMCTMFKKTIVLLHHVVFLVAIKLSNKTAHGNSIQDVAMAGKRMLAWFKSLTNKSFVRVRKLS